MSDGLERSTGCKVSEMWVGMRTVCGATSMVVGITVADKTHVFLATRVVVGQLADQIAAMLDEPIPGPHGSEPRFLSRNGGSPREPESKPARRWSADSHASPHVFEHLR